MYVLVISRRPIVRFPFSSFLRYAEQNNETSDVLNYLGDFLNWHDVDLNTPRGGRRTRALFNFYLGPLKRKKKRNKKTRINIVNPH